MLDAGYIYTVYTEYSRNTCMLQNYFTSDENRVISKVIGTRDGSEGEVRQMRKIETITNLIDALLFSFVFRKVELPQLAMSSAPPHPMPTHYPSYQKKMMQVRTLKTNLRYILI